MYNLCLCTNSDLYCFTLRENFIDPPNFAFLKEFRNCKNKKKVIFQKKTLSLNAKNNLTFYNFLTFKFCFAAAHKTFVLLTLDWQKVKGSSVRLYSVCSCLIAVLGLK